MSRSRTRVAFVTVAAMAIAAAGLLAQGGHNPGQTSPGAQPVGTLSIPGITGAPTAIYGFGFEATNSGGFAGGGGAGAGQVSLGDIVVTKEVDASSPELFRAAVLGVHLPAARIELYPAAGKTGHSAFQLTNVIVTRVANDNGTESLSLDFARVEVSAGGSSYCYDVQTNTAC
jgi:hypothetical protein